jgi:hypothetical protein
MEASDQLVSFTVLSQTVIPIANHKRPSVSAKAFLVVGREKCHCEDRRFIC